MGRALFAMAVVCANWNDSKDYLSNFEAFAVDVLARWPPDKPVSAVDVKRQIADEWTLELPLGVVETLIKRARRRGLARYDQDTQNTYVVPEAFADGHDLREKRETAQREMTALVRALQAHAQQHQAPWSEREAEGALLAYLDEYGVDFAAHRRNGALMPSVSATEAVAMVHSFARRALEEGQIELNYLEHAVQGSMLASVLYLDDLGSVPAALNRVVVYLDTPILLRALGVARSEMVDGAKDLLILLRAANVSVRVFEHTVEEIYGVLGNVADGLQRPRPPEVARDSRTNREVLDHAVARRLTTSQVLAIRVQLARRLRELGVQTEDLPNGRQRLDTKALADQLQDTVRYGRDVTRERDVASLAAVHRLRRGRTFRRLVDCPAVFVTSNAQLARASRDFFSNMHDDEHAIPHCMYEPELVTQLWILAPGKCPELPRRQVILDAYSVLNPPTSVWHRYFDGVERLEREGVITADEVMEMLVSVQARAALADLTLGLDDRFDDVTVEAVREKVVGSQEPSAPVAEEVPVASIPAAPEPEPAVDDVRLRGLEEEIERLKATIARERRMLRFAGTAALFLLFGACAALPVVLHDVDALATIAFVAIGLIGMVAAACLAFLPARRVPATVALTVGTIAAAVTFASAMTSPRGKRAAPAAAEIGSRHR